jgi:hypothetical protein
LKTVVPQGTGGSNPSSSARLKWKSEELKGKVQDIIPASLFTLYLSGEVPKSVEGDGLLNR